MTAHQFIPVVGALSTAALGGILLAITAIAAHGEPPPEVTRPRPGHAGPPPIIAALDADKDRTLSAEEIANAPKSLATLDRNHDGQLSPEELRPQDLRPDGPPREPRSPRPDFQRPPGGPRPGAGAAEGGPPDGPRPGDGARPDGPRPFPRRLMALPPAMAALDADRDRTLSSGEISGAAEALRKLDKNNDGRLDVGEMMPGRPVNPPREGRGPGGPRGPRPQ